MSSRIEAAAAAIEAHMFGPVKLGELAGATIEAADAVMFTDDAVERAAKAVHDLGSRLGWTERVEEVRELYREDVRAVIAALKEGS